MRHRLTAFLLCLPLLFYGIAGAIVLSGEHNSYESVFYHVLSHDGSAESLPYHDAINHIHETLNRVVLLSLPVITPIVRFEVAFIESSPIRRHYRLLRPPLPFDQTS